MRRVFVALLTLLVAVQFSWAAAAGYCAHEAVTGATSHFGHHAHSHAGESQKPGAKALMMVADLDHGHCHLVHAVMASGILAGHGVDGQAAPRADGRAPVESHIPDGLDRPNWQRA